MARTKSLVATMNLVPVLFWAAFAGAGWFGVTSLMGQVTSTEYDCTVTKFEKVAGSPEELLIHTDGCSNTTKEGNIFKADETKLEDNFTEEDFYKGVKAGKTYNFMIQGMTVEPLNMIPTVTKVSESFLPF